MTFKIKLFRNFTTRTNKERKIQHRKRSAAVPTNRQVPVGASAPRDPEAVLEVRLLPEHGLVVRVVARLPSPGILLEAGKYEEGFALKDAPKHNNVGGLLRATPGEWGAALGALAQPFTLKNLQPTYEKNYLLNDDNYLAPSGRHISQI